MDINIKLGVILGCVAMARAAVERDAPVVLLKALRRAIDHAGLSDKEIALGAGASASVTARKLRGEKPITFDFLYTLPLEALQWFAVELAAAVGTPSLLNTGATLRRYAEQRENTK